MSFEDLPPNWTHLPLDTPGLGVDVVDLLLTISDREANCLLVELCDENGVGQPAPLKVSGMDWNCPAQERAQALEAVAQLQVEAPIWASGQASVGAPGMLLAVSSSRALHPDPMESWRSSAQQALERVGSRMVGFYAATPRGVVEIHGS